MALTKKDLLKRASEIGIKYARERSKDDLERLIAKADRGEDIDPLPTATREAIEERQKKQQPEPKKTTCFRCGGSGEMCDICGENPEACECEKDGEKPTFGPCDDCHGTGT